MSEFKFACSVCGQHITADSDDAGSQMECPTCFRQIVIPQPPSSSDPKLILSAAEAGKPRPIQAASPVDPYRSTFGPKSSSWKWLVVLAALFVVGIFLLVFWKQLFPSRRERIEAAKEAKALAFQSVLSNVPWSLNVYDLTFPDTNAVGRILGSDFTCQKTILMGGVFLLRQYGDNAPEIKVRIYLPPRQTDEWRGQTVTVTTNDAVGPEVELRWEDDQRTIVRTFTNDYVLKLQFGEPAADRMPGEIYLCLPDEGHSRVGGTFDAEMRRAPRQWRR